jgi:hypothetical protein
MKLVHMPSRCAVRAAIAASLQHNGASLQDIAKSVGSECALSPAASRKDRCQLQRTYRRGPSRYGLSSACRNQRARFAHRLAPGLCRRQQFQSYLHALDEIPAGQLPQAAPNAPNRPSRRPAFAQLELSRRVWREMARLVAELARNGQAKTPLPMQPRREL